MWWQRLATTKNKNRKGDQAKSGKTMLRKTFRVNQRPTPSGEDLVVAINVDGRPTTKEDRRSKWPLWHSQWPLPSKAVRYVFVNADERAQEYLE